MAQNNSSQPRSQATSYTTPHSYPSPPMQATYAYPPPNGQQPGEPYRDSPPTANQPLPSINQLAPLRAHESDRRPMHDQMNTMMTTGLPPAMVPGSSYYPPPASPYNGMGMPMTGSPSQQGMNARFPMASHSGSMMSGGRNKKEIKRRTKTGCLTCRKRRIKCDEAHPVCRNCQKSKRDCLGYDPIFKQQQQESTSPAPIQPALVSGEGISPIPTTAETPTSTYSSVPQGYAPASINSPSPSVSQTYDYNSAIDPALAGSDSAALSSANAFDSNQTFPSEVKGETENGSPYTTTAAGAAETKPKRTLKIDDLFMMGDDPPTPAPSKDIPQQMYDEIKELYKTEYAKGIDAFLETTWYTTKGLHYLLKDIGTCELFQSYVEHLQKVKHEDYDDMRKMPGHEARVVWALMCLTRFAATQMNSEAPTIPYDEQLNEITRRLAIFEHLITGQVMLTNPLAHTQPQQTAQKDSKYYRTEFWRLLGQFVSLQTTEPDQLNHTLGSLRSILRQHENRDVLYSIAIVRHFGADDQDQGQGNEQDQEKVIVAKTFIENEAAGQGTSQVIQRLCGMAARSWMAMR